MARDPRLVLAWAAHLITTETYSPKFAAALPDGRQTFVLDPRATIFSITGAIERSSRIFKSGKVPARGDPAMIAATKAIVCRHLGAVHLDGWEIAAKPDWKMVRRALEGAAA